MVVDKSTASVVLNQTYEDTGRYECSVSNGIINVTSNTKDQTKSEQIEIKGTENLGLKHLMLFSRVYTR